MFLATDVQYDDSTKTALAAGVLFENWGDEVPLREIVVPCTNIAPYVPGEFYKRELPCLMNIVFECMPDSPDAIIVDGFVDLGEKPGLGRYLRTVTGIPVIGVAKTGFHQATPERVLRGDSKKPLFVTSAAFNISVACDGLVGMHGDYRIPTLLKRVDSLARGR